MEGKDISRLEEEQQKAIQSTEQDISTWEKFKSDYTALKDRLRTLPDKVSHPIMVPFGKKAFMPGRLVHTNEVLVLLGENWFAERSAKQACEIIDRRLVGINKQIEDLCKQRDLLTPRVDFTSELQDLAQAKGDLFEIQEEFDEEKEKKWREQHRKNVQKQRRKEKEERQKLTSEKNPDGTTKAPLSDSELWARLEELERIETEQNELSGLSFTHTTDQRQSPVREKSVRWADEGKDNTEQTDSSEGEEPERPKCIHFKHSVGDVASEAGGNNSVEPASSEYQKITSPADVYKLIHPAQPTCKSILKSKSETGDTKRSEEAEIEEKAFKPHSATAFSGNIVERDNTALVSIASETSKTDRMGGPASKPSKRVSKFKSDRQKQQSSNR